MRPALDSRELRNAFGTFMTGVTVITTREREGIPRGFTANSFCSVSLDPPLVSVCIAKTAESVEVFTSSGHFAINILAENQIETSGIFASRRADKFDVTPWRNSKGNSPILKGVCAWFDCVVVQQVDAGDHVVLIGEVQGFDYNDHNGLGYVRGGYVTLGLEQAAVNAATGESGVVVGALVDCGGKLLLEQNPENGRYLPVASGLNASQGSINRLKDHLDLLEIGAVVNSLYAVFEGDNHERHHIFYRATAEQEGKATFYAPDEIPWDNLESSAIRTMLERYLKETLVQRYGIYFGGEEKGRVEITETKKLVEKEQ